MENATFGLTFTPAELALVAGMLNVPSLVLLEDPFDGLPTEQIEGTLRQAQKSLVARQYVQVQDDGSIALDTAVAALVGALGFAEASLVATRTVGEERSPSTRHIHFAAGLIVEEEQRRDRSHALTAVRDQDAVCQRLKDFLHLAGQPAPPFQPSTLREADVAEARLVITVEGEVAGRELLQDAGVPSAAAVSLAAALGHPTSQSTLFALSWEGQEAQQLDHLTWIEGTDGLWLVRPLDREGESWLEMAPCDAPGAFGQVQRLVNLVIPAGQT